MSPKLRHGTPVRLIRDHSRTGTVWQVRPFWVLLSSGILHVPSIRKEWEVTP